MPSWTDSVKRHVDMAKGFLKDKDLFEHIGLPGVSNAEASKLPEGTNRKTLLEMEKKQGAGWGQAEVE